MSRTPVKRTILTVAAALSLLALAVPPASARHIRPDVANYYVCSEPGACLTENGDGGDGYVHGDYQNDGAHDQLVNPLVDIDDCGIEALVEGSPGFCPFTDHTLDTKWAGASLRYFDWPDEQAEDGTDEMQGLYSKLPDATYAPKGESGTLFAVVYGASGENLIPVLLSDAAGGSEFLCSADTPGADAEYLPPADTTDACIWNYLSWP